MKVLATLLLATALGLGFATASFAECAGHKTATTSEPTTPAPVAPTTRT